MATADHEQAMQFLNRSPGEQGDGLTDSGDFMTVEEFAGELSERSDLTERRSASFVRLSDDRLRAQAASTAQALTLFEQAASSIDDDPEAIDDFIRDLDTRRISRDHDWRGIFELLRDAPGVTREHCHVAVRAYADYLGACSEMLAAMCAKRLAAEDAGKETQALRAFRAEAEMPDDLTRLPRGERVELRIPYRGELALWLGRHRFLIQDSFPPRFIDPEGGSCVLRIGPQSVGRNAQRDVPVDADFSDVSRKHLTLEWKGGTEIWATDLSSLGTFTEPVAETDAAAEPVEEERSTTTGTRTGNVRLAVARGSVRPEDC